MLPAFLALGASAVWGVVDFAAAVRARNLGPIVVAFLVQLWGAVLLIALLPFTWGAFPGWHIWIPAAIAGVCGACAHPVFYAALSRGPMGVIAPILATSSAVPVLYGILAAGERPAPLQYAGLVLAIAGVVLVSRHAAEGDSAHGRYGAVPLALIAIALSSVMFIALAAASEQSGLWGVTAQRTVGLPLLATFVLVTARRGGDRPTREGLRAIAPIGIADTAALALFAVATSLGDLSIAIVLASLYPVVTVLLARFRLGEHLAPVQRIGAVLAFAGIAAVVGGG